ncbi:hypothetical protein VPH35_081205 [Triticum aestivum]
MSVTVANKTPDAVRQVMAWALLNAFVFVVSYAMGYAIDCALHHYHVSCSKFSFILRCDQLTDAERNHWIVILSCATFQAAAAALVLWLPGRHRWVLCALAYLALLLTVVGHCMFFADVCLNLAADPGRLVCWILCTMAIVFYAVGDIISFMTLLCGGED